MSALSHLVDLVARLRGTGGCDWDRAQTLASMRPYLLEEAYEVLDAIDAGDPAALRTELGDLLFVVLLVARISEEEGAFGIEEAAASIADKMIRRHPHVFDPAHEKTDADYGTGAWERRKQAERGGAGSALDGIPKALPALLRAQRTAAKASRVGFDWPDIEGVRDKVREETAELDEALASGDADAITHEYGDLLLALVNLGRFLPVGAEDALRLANDRFAQRFRRVEDVLREEGTTVHEVDLDRLERTWQRIKRQ